VNLRIPRLNTLLLCATTLLAAHPHAQAQSAPAPLQAIARIDVPRYMGTWYEVARYPNRFQKQCVADVQAQYTLRLGGRVTVLNRCRVASGATEEAVGEARQIGAADAPKLEVRFAPAWLAWLPMVWGDYWVVDLDPAYQLAAVSEPSREYLWVLSRTPQVALQAYADLLVRLTAQGLDVTRLERTPQTMAP
jgi:apolipoprotein D and lipocalin family protein